MRLGSGYFLSPATILPKAIQRLFSSLFFFCDDERKQSLVQQAKASDTGFHRAVRLGCR
jgi:hypothetical protein